jgi:PHD/YefM family antitoxin component YafN of YafNO toxin-antitoxin module
MKIISSREFRDNQKMYFDLADNQEQIIVQRGKNKAYMLTPISEIDRLSVNPILIEKIREAEKSLKAGEYTEVDSTKSIWEQIGLDKNE